MKNALFGGRFLRTASRQGAGAPPQVYCNLRCPAGGKKLELKMPSGLT